MKNKVRVKTIRLGGKFPIQFADYNQIAPSVLLEVEVPEGVEPSEAIEAMLPRLQEGLHMVTAALMGMVSQYADATDGDAVRAICKKSLMQAGLIPEVLKTNKRAVKKVARRTRAKT